MIRSTAPVRAGCMLCTQNDTKKAWFIGDSVLCLTTWCDMWPCNLLMAVMLYLSFLSPRTNNINNRDSCLQSHCFLVFRPITMPPSHKGKVKNLWLLCWLYVFCYSCAVLSVALLPSEAIQRWLYGEYIVFTQLSCLLAAKKKVWNQVNKIYHCKTFINCCQEKHTHITVYILQSS